VKCVKFNTNVLTV